MLRATAYLLFQATRGRSRKPRRLSKGQADCVNLWRAFLIVAFDHPEALSTTFYDALHNDPNHIKESDLGEYRCYTDATPELIGLYVPGLGWAEVEIPPDWVLSIAMAELLGLILCYALAKILDPNAPNIHIYIDNKNAEAWSTGRIQTSNSCAINLVFLNGYLQSAFNVTQTRSYIRSVDNVQADAISRRRWLNSDNLPQYKIQKSWLVCLTELVQLQEPDPSQTLALALTLLESDAFWPFSKF
jgi:hypothetical protein